MIMIRRGNLFASDADALVNTVNCVGVMGKGIAHQFKRRYPDMFATYAAECKAGEVLLGEVRAYAVPDGKTVINFPTKKHWRSKSRLSDIEQGLNSLRALILSDRISSVAVPPLGCGNGGLDWQDVRPLIENALQDLENVQIHVYEPVGKRTLRSTKVERKPRVSLSHFVLADLVNRLERPSKVGMQKAAYFFNVYSGEQYFRFKEHKYGPYCPDIDRLGQAIRDYRDYTSIDRKDFVSAGRTHELAGTDVDRWDRWSASIAAAAGLVDRYGPHTAELLATLHAIIVRDGPVKDEEIPGRFFAWSDEKSESFTAADVKQGLRTLEHEGLVTNTLWGLDAVPAAALSPASTVEFRLPKRIVDELARYAGDKNTIDELVATAIREYLSTASAPGEVA